MHHPPHALTTARSDHRIAAEAATLSHCQHQLTSCNHAVCQHHAYTGGELHWLLRPPSGFIALQVKCLNFACEENYTVRLCKEIVTYHYPDVRRQHSILSCFARAPWESEGTASAGAHAKAAPASEPRAPDAPAPARLPAAGDATWFIRATCFE